MKIIFLNHHSFFTGYSMHRYSQFLKEGMASRGHDAQIWAPKPILANKGIPKSLNKWLRYLDQFLLFPFIFKIRSRNQPKDTLYVLVDQALGMWMPMLKDKKHVVHCHDFTALKSSLGIIAENPTSFSGKKYQSLILKGFRKANNFIAISKNTKRELEQFLDKEARRVEQVYNALDPSFAVGPKETARKYLEDYLGLDLSNGYLLHVGGNDFYKNRIGVIAIYEAWRKTSKNYLPLLLIGYEPAVHIQEKYEASTFKKDIHFLVRVKDDLLINAYQGASFLLFPSLMEGFGWPIAEAMASGCPVITTGEAPMNEVGGDAALYIPRCPHPSLRDEWAKECAKVVEECMNLTPSKRNELIEKGIQNAKRFDAELILNQLEEIYTNIVKEQD